MAERHRLRFAPGRLAADDQQAADAHLRHSRGLREQFVHDEGHNVRAIY
ncbi:hypothetical protein ACRUMN_00600 [Kluyvera cryocrescens]